MNLSDLIGHGGMSGAKAIGTIRWRPQIDDSVRQDGDRVKGAHPRVGNAIHEVWATVGEDRTDYLIETNDSGMTVINYGMKATFFRWKQVELAEVWYW